MSSLRCTQIAAATQRRCRHYTRSASGDCGRHNPQYSHNAAEDESTSPLWCPACASALEADTACPCGASSEFEHTSEIHEGHRTRQEHARDWEQLALIEQRRQAQSRARAKRPSVWARLASWLRRK